MREQLLGGVVLEGLATPQEDAKDHQGVARLVRAQVHAGGREEVSSTRGVVVEVGPTGSALMLDAVQEESRPLLCSRSASRTGSLSGVVRFGGSDWSERMRWLEENYALPSPRILLFWGGGCPHP